MRWFDAAARRQPPQQRAPIVVLDNHWHVGGQGDAVRAALDGRPVAVWGIDRVPVCGSNEEVLREHRLDTDSLVERLRAL